MGLGLGIWRLAFGFGVWLAGCGLPFFGQGPGPGLSETRLLCLVLAVQELCSEDQADLELGDSPATASQVSGLKAAVTLPSSSLLLLTKHILVSGMEFSILSFNLHTILIT